MNTRNQMSTTIDNDLLEDILKTCLPSYRDELERKLREARNLRDHWTFEADDLEKKLDRIEEYQLASSLPKQSAVAETGEGGRVKKGLSEKLIVDFLKASNGLGASIPQIVDSTGTTLSTVRRIVNKLANEQKVESAAHSRWKWKTENNLSAVAGHENGAAT